jgi:hypothetical protein
MYAYRIPQEEPCPVSEDTLGALYRATPEGLPALVDSIPPRARALLAIYCHRRAHLSSIGLAIASTCDKNDMINFGGDAGAALFEQARRAPKVNTQRQWQRKVSLSSGAIMQVVIDQDLV